MKFNYLLFILLYILITSNTILSQKLLNGNIWHITDTHFDFSYQPGGDPDDMCRIYKSSHHKGEDHDKDTQSASPVGNYRCDTSYQLLISAFEEMAKIEPNPDFIIWTGDDVPHLDNSELNQSLIIQSIVNMTDLIQYYFPGVRVFPSIGNHDSYPQHQIAVGPNWLLNQVAEIWSPFLSNDSLETVKVGGYYSELFEPGLRIVSLNTVFYYTQNKQCTNQSDPAGQLAWLNETLSMARQNQEKVLVIAHVAPGYCVKYSVFNFHFQFNDIYLETFGNYSDIIIAHIYGHEHTDNYRLYYSQPSSVVIQPEWDEIDQFLAMTKQQMPSGVMFMSPSLTPYMDPYVPALPNNPSLRMFQYNTTSYQLLDYLQFWSNLTDNIMTNQINWMLEYKAKDFYHVEALDPISMYEAYLLIENTEEMLDIYHYYNSVSYPTKGCDEICRKIQLCSMRHPYSKGFEGCLVVL
ncbi:metallophosphoesterase domain-containing protein [Tieghemostelium lacteum]|uniref:Metallophosphoesterase domain-containing protein n=1 Tax=Tieghemostelium lacteum TaxID=361077 RepID=A0A152A9A6_TIELA|nr:metallophosphoesterase domain-containing protein [Tieghemostelium lacteum]|eukprot:KYR02711.1 metallophosphoesterase domain-containing protein [Tieghemostelium lacteum]